MNIVLAVVLIMFAVGNFFMLLMVGLARGQTTTVEMTEAKIIFSRFGSIVKIIVFVLAAYLLVR